MESETVLPADSTAPPESHAPEVGAMQALSWLLYPRGRALRYRATRLWRTGRPQLTGLLLLAALFWGGVFYLLHRALGYFLSYPEFGSILTYKLLSMIFVVFFSVLVFSNIVTALS